jgi:hypothetical protein
MSEALTPNDEEAGSVSDVHRLGDGFQRNPGAAHVE